MQRRFHWVFLVAILMALGLNPSSRANDVRLIKVLPQFLDKEGRQALTPSLYDRDAYQAFLRKNPDKRSGLRFAVQWKGISTKDHPLKLSVELRGVSEVKGTRTVELSLKPQKHSWWSHWDNVIVNESSYKELKEVTAWKVVLWDGDHAIGEEKSFLW